MKRKQAMLWIHGWGMSPQCWGHGPDGVDVSAMMTGYAHHYMDYSSCCTVHDFSSALKDKMKSDEPTSWTLVGWSLGAMLALEAAFAGADGTANSQIESIVIVAGTLCFTSTDRASGWPARVVSRMRARLADNSAEVLEHFRRSMFTEEESTAGWIEKAIYWDTDFSPEGLDAGLAYLLESDLRLHWETIVSRMDRPKLLWLHGTADSICPAGAVPVLPDALLAWMNGAGHAPFVTQAQQFYDRLRRFTDDQ